MTDEEKRNKSETEMKGEKETKVKPDDIRTTTPIEDATVSEKAAAGNVILGSKEPIGGAIHALPGEPVSLEDVSDELIDKPPANEEGRDKRNGESGGHGKDDDD
jgi:hypothetical protein